MPRHTLSVRGTSLALQNLRSSEEFWAVNGLPASSSYLTLNIAEGLEMTLYFLVISQLPPSSGVWLW